LIESWLDSKSQTPSSIVSKGRLRAFSLIHEYLGEQTADENLQKRLMAHIFNIIGGKYMIETRVDAMEALGVMLTHTSTSTDPEIAVEISKVLRLGLTDYTNDQRGDIGSLLRLRTLETIDACRDRPTSTAGGLSLDSALPLIVKLAAEKLNNVRFRAWKTLEKFWHADASLSRPESTFLYPADVSSVTYFEQLMRLLSVPWARRHLVLGLVSSATAGTEDICRAASVAFVSYLRTLEFEPRAKLIDMVSAIVLEELGSNSSEEDRHVVPLLEFCCFMIDQNLFHFELIIQPNESRPGFWDIMQSVHNTASSMQRIEASLNVYLRLLSVDDYRTRALDKLTRQLLHRWPRVRYAFLMFPVRCSDVCRSETPPPTFCTWTASTMTWRLATGTNPWSRSSRGCCVSAGS
jgi:tubulin-specific chaperone D